jgi:phytoene synthase
MPPPWTDAAAADLAACRTLLQAGSRSFDAAARLLPRSVRDPAVALYAFCRVADDAIDGQTAPPPPGDAAAPVGPPEVSRDSEAGLAWLRQRLASAYAGRPLPLPADRAFARIVEAFAIPRALPDALLEGFAWDAEGRRYADLPALRAYAVRVAGTVGAMMAVLMGVRDAARLGAAIDLGVAMQLSNIARDVGEDARAGRLYLPEQWLLQAGIDPDAFLAAPAHSPQLGRVVQRLLAAADEHYRRASAGIARLPLACRFGIGAASLLYAEIGREVARRGLDAVSGRAVVSGRRKVRVLAGGIAAFAVPRRRLAATVIPEGAFLVDAVVQSALPPKLPVAPVPWWNLPEHLLWVIDLFERLEHRQRVRP